MAEIAEGTRRERLRAQTLAEIREHALAQLAQGGPEALSLNAIARTMRMSGPALYRYFASREDLLVALVTDSYDDLASAVEAAAEDLPAVPRPGAIASGPWQPPTARGRWPTRTATGWSSPAGTGPGCSRPNA